jgi:hypothetical protein
VSMPKSQDLGRAEVAGFGGDVVVEGVALEGFRIDLLLLPLEGSSVLTLTGGGGSGLGGGKGRGNGGFGGKPPTAATVPREGEGATAVVRPPASTTPPAAVAREEGEER